MYDKKLNDRLLQINARYQELLHSNAFETQNKNKRYLNNLKKLDFDSILKDLKYRNYAKQHFSTNGNNVKSNEQRQDLKGKKIAVYTCIVGNYDRLLEPVYKEPGVDYLIFTDQEIPNESTWEKINLQENSEYNMLSPMMMNRKIKIQQSEELLKYDYTVYVDGNIEMVAAVSPMIECMGKTNIGLHYHRGRDCVYDESVAVKHLKHIKGEQIDKQLESYKVEGFPEHFGLFENSMIIRNNRDLAVLDLMNKWWEEFQKHPTRDQFSLPYVIWKTKYDRDKICILGNDIERNPVFNRIGEHR